MPTNPWNIVAVEDAPPSGAAPAAPAGDPWKVVSVADPQLGLAPVPVPKELQGPNQPVTPGYMGIPSTPSNYDWNAVVQGAKRNIFQFGSDVGQMSQNVPDLGGSSVQMQPNGQLTPTPAVTSPQIQQFQKSAQRPLVPLAEGAQPGTLTHGLLAGAEALTTPQNISIGLAAWPLSTAAKLAQVGYDAVAIRTLNAGLGLYFTKEMAGGAAENVKQAYAAYQRGDIDTVADKLGAGTVQAILAGLGLYHAGSNLREIGNTPVPKLPETRTDLWSLGHSGNFQGATPEVVPDLPAGESVPATVPKQPQTIDVQPEPAATTPGSSPSEPSGSALAPEPSANSWEVASVEPAEPLPAAPQSASPTAPAATDAVQLSQPSVAPNAGPQASELPAAPSLVTDGSSVTPPAEPGSGGPWQVQSVEPAVSESAEAAGIQQDEDDERELTAFEGEEPEAANPAAVEPAPAEPQQEPAPTAPPRGVQELPTSAIHADPVRFQFKADTGGKAGVGEELKSIQQFDPELSGVVAVWYDPADGKTYVVNGHHRLELAQRTGQPTVAARYINAANAQDAYRTGALINIAEGRGTPIDAAKVFRDSALTPASLEKRGISLRGPVARQGMALAQLAPAIFERVVRGDLPIERAVILGEQLPAHQEQAAALALLDKAETRGKRPTNAEVRELIDFVKSGPRANTEDSQTNLFGEEEVSKNAAWEKAEISDYIRKRLGQERRVFTTTANPRAAEQLSQAGNVLNTEANQRIAEQAAQAQQIYDKLKTSAGPVNDVLDRSARELVGGGNAAEIKARAYDETRQAVADTFGGRSGADRGGSGGPSPSGPAAAGLFEGQAPASAGSAPDSSQNKLDDDEPTLLADTAHEDLAQVGFYSQLERVIADKMPAKVSPAQALAILQNPQHGVKAEELKWTGVADWLRQQKQPLTRQQILERAQAERVSVRERAKPIAGRYTQYTLPGQHTQYTELLFQWDPPKPETPAYATYRKIFDQLQAKYGHQKYPDTHGHLWEWFQDGITDRFDAGVGQDPLTPAERKAYEEAVDEWDDEERFEQRHGANAYSSPHWDERNVLAHARFDERRDAEGRRVLFVEEIQSDWHQEGRKKGYQDAQVQPPTWDSIGGGGTVPDAPFRSNWQELVFRRLVRWAAENGYDALAWTTGKQQAERYDLAKHVSGIRFRPTTDPYLNERYDRDHDPRRWGQLATPEEIAKGSRAAGEPIGFLYTRRLARRGEDADLLDWDMLRNEPIKASELPDYIGKELARKLLAETPAAVPDDLAYNDGLRYELTGDDLSIGGHGMSGFYDSMLPAYAAKFGKKWGAHPELRKIDATAEPSLSRHYEGPTYSIEKVQEALALAQSRGTTTISPFTGRRMVFVFQRVDNVQALETLLNHLKAGTPFHEAVDRSHPDMFADMFGGKIRTDKHPQPTKTETVHALPVTDAMRESVLQGQPLFSKALSGQAYDPAHNYTNSEIIGAADWEIHAQNDRRALRLRVNWQAGQTLAHVLRMGSFEGVTLPANGLPLYARRLAEDAQNWFIRGTISQPAAQRMLELAETLLRMHGNAQGRPIFLQRDRIPEAGVQPGARMARLREQAATQREEQTHIQQANHARAFEGKNAEAHLTPAGLADATQDSNWPRIQAALAAHDAYYGRQPLALQVLEAGAKLIAGRFDQIRVPLAVADAWLRVYYRALKEAHAEENARAVFRFADKRFKLIPGEEEGHAQSGFGRPSNLLHARSGDADASQAAGGQQGGTGNNGRSGEGGDGRNGGTLRDSGGETDAPLFQGEERERIGAGLDDYRAQLEHERLTRQLNAPLTREEQLKKLKRSKQNPQTDLFGENEEPPQGALFDRDKSQTLGSGLGALQPYVEKFLKSDLAPTAKQLAEVFGLLKHDVLKVLAPAAVDDASKATALSVRANAADLQRQTDRAEAALRMAEKFFAAQKPEFNFAFMDRVEKGEAQPTPELEQIAAVMRQILDTRREAIRALGKGKLEKFIENYFPHIWKKPQQAAEFYANVTKRPLEGAKSFLKKRSIDSIAAGLEAGLEPVSTNPVELVRLKAREMDKYLTAQHIFAELKEQGLLQFVDAREGQAPFGWKKIDDPSATVYGPSIQNITEYPNEGLWSTLEKVADALGVKHERGFLNLRGAIGRASRGGTIKTLHGTAEDVVAHELGHQIDFRAGSGRKFIEEYPDKQTSDRIKRARKALKDAKLSTPEERKFARAELKDLAPAIQRRKAFAKELRDLADLRSGRPEYTHKREEKMAQLAEMWVGARELFERTAPTVFQEWKQFLDANPKLHALRDIEGNTEVTALSQPYDVGGLVIKGHWWAPEAAARIVNNYLSPGLREKFAGVRVAMGLANLINQAQLGFSGFHAVFTGLESATSKLALGVYQAAHGDLAQAAKSIAQTPAAPFTTLMRGHRMKNEWYRPGTQGAAIGQLVDAMQKAGGRAHMESFYRTHLAKKMVEAWRAGNLFGALLRAPFAAFEVPTRLIMEELVPRLKMGAFADMAEYELRRLPADATVEDVQRVMGKAWDSIDNRFGQLVYDDLFWHRYVKDIALLTVRSPGWNVGDIRELAGGYADTGRALIEGAKKASGKNGKPEFSHRMAYIPAHLLVAATVGAVLYYIWHGEAPRRLKDYFFPKDNHGKRWSPATYVKDEYNWTHDPARTAAGKINPLLRALAELAENRDYRDKPIVNRHHALPKELKELAEYIGQQFEPLWVEQMTQRHQHHTTQDKLLPEFGITRAPKSLDHARH